MSTMHTAALPCHYCSGDFYAPSEKLLLNHIRLVHSSEPGFCIQCSRNGCSRTFKNFRTYQNHLAKHPQSASNVPSFMNVQCNGNTEDSDDLGGNEEESDLPIHSTADLQSFAVKWLLKTRESRYLTRAAAQGIVEDVQDLADMITRSLRSETEQLLLSMGVDNEIITTVKDIFSSPVTRPFENVMSFHQQLQYCRKHFGFVEPRRIVLKETRIQRQTGRRRKICVKKEEFIYIPLLESLQSLLSNETVFEEVMNSSRHESSATLLHDYCDAKRYREHPLFSLNHSALQLIIYYDELELCNPLGSRRKIHKIGAFYYILGNLRPALRSKTDTIQLLALAKYTTVSAFGIDRIFEPAVEDIKKLENGVSFVLHGVSHEVQGTVTIVSGDNPASSALGGFKESASAFRYCRHCLGTRKDIQSQFVESRFNLRSSTSHSRHCDILENEDLTVSDRQHYSLTYGVNRRALLDSLLYFNVSSGALIPDVMHDILEGALPYEVKCMLQFFIIEQRSFSLSDIDSGIKNLNIRPFDGDKPSSVAGIALTTTDSNLHQHAMQMWTLARFLPLAVGHKIDRQDQDSMARWENFLCLLDIIDIVFARVISTDCCGYLETLISDHHSCFRGLYSDAGITLKMHSMVHLPRLILEFGPLINHWTTRFEAKHKYFKHLANVLGNFINICFSLALRHQLRQCYLSLNSILTLPGEDVEIGPGKPIECSVTLWNSTFTLPCTSYFSANWVKINGTKYQTPCALVVGKSDDDELLFGEVLRSLVDIKSVFFEFELLESIFCHHYHCYSVSSPSLSQKQKYYIKHSDLLTYHPYGLYHCHSVSEDHTSRCIVLRSNIYV